MKKVSRKPSKKSAAKKSSPADMSRACEQDDMLDDYSHLDWSKAERGKYAKRYLEATNVVLIEPDLTDIFPNADSVNRALRALAEVIRASPYKNRRAG